jgi:hypothetical protein
MPVGRRGRVTIVPTTGTPRARASGGEAGRTWTARHAKTYAEPCPGSGPLPASSPCHLSDENSRGKVQNVRGNSSATGPWRKRARRATADSSVRDSAALRSLGPSSRGTSLPHCVEYADCRAIRPGSSFRTERDGLSGRDRCEPAVSPVHRSAEVPQGTSLLEGGDPLFSEIRNWARFSHRTGIAFLTCLRSSATAEWTVHDHRTV